MITKKILDNTVISAFIIEIPSIEIIDICRISAGPRHDK